MRSPLVDITASGTKPAADRVSALLDTALTDTITALQAAR